MAQTQGAEAENRLARIERGIDREVAGNLPISRSSAGTFTIAPQSMGELLEFSKLMSVSDFCVRPAFRGNPGACLAVALQAFRCGGDPFAWANKAYITKNKSGEEQISYEAQLVHAVVISSGVLQRRLRPVYEGAGSKRKCRIVGYIKGENEAFEYESPTVEEIAVKNSPLWVADRDQQLYYYATRAWARRFVPEILLGIYAPEEMGEVLDMTPEPEPQRGDYIDHAAAPEPEPEMFEVVALDGEVFSFEAPQTALDALATVLAGARRGGAKMLEAARENNEALFAHLLRADAGPALMELMLEYVPASPPPVASEGTAAPRSSPPPQPEEARSAVSAAAGAPQATEVPAPPAEPAEPEPAPSAPPAAAAAGGPANDEENRFPGDLPHGGPGSDEPVDWRQGPRGVEGPTGAAVPAEPAAPPPPTTAEPAGERVSMAIRPPLARGKPDWRTFVRALLIPKIRQQTTGDDLAWLLGDNAAHIESARSSVERGDMAELDQAIDAAWTRLRPN